jgi:hypothetical protein
MSHQRQQSIPAQAGLPGTAHAFLVFAEHAPTEAELDHVLSEVAEHDEATVTVVIHHNPMPGETRIYEHGGVLHDDLVAVVDRLRAAGARAQGELVSGDLRHALETEIRLRNPDAVILLPGHHLLAHLAHRDLAHRLRHHTSVPILAVNGRGPHLV